jgi:hypothetical protein
MVFDSVFLDVAISIVFVYLLLSLICSAVSELFARVFAWRSSTLAKGIRNLLNDPNAADLEEIFYKHPLIDSMDRDGNFDKLLKRHGKPSYIASRTFAIALLDIIAPASGKETKTFEQVRNALDTTNSKIINPKTKTALLALFNNSQNNLDNTRKNIEDWFNDGMDRVSGWYKRNVQYLILGLALIITVGANIDTVMIANNLAQDSTLRSSVVASAVVFANQTASSGSNASLNIQELRNETQQIQLLPIGWSYESNVPQGLPTGWGWLTKIIGLFITVIAVSLGAPFWFDTLNKLIDIRGTGKQP